MRARSRETDCGRYVHRPAIAASTAFTNDNLFTLYVPINTMSFRSLGLFPRLCGEALPAVPRSSADGERVLRRQLRDAAPNKPPPLLVHRRQTFPNAVLPRRGTNTASTFGLRPPSTGPLLRVSAASRHECLMSIICFDFCHCSSTPGLFARVSASSTEAAAWARRSLSVLADMRCNLRH